MEKDKILSQATKEVIWIRTEGHTCNHRDNMLGDFFRSDWWNTRWNFVALTLDAGGVESCDNVWLFPLYVKDMYSCVEWGKYFPQDNGMRKTLQLQPAYSHTENSWWLGFVIPPSHYDILVSLPMAISLLINVHGSFLCHILPALCSLTLWKSQL